MDLSKARPHMPGFVDVNGELCSEREAVVSVFDHGFLFGEGVYEVLRTCNGRPFLFDRHLRRLRKSAEMIALPVPIPDAEFLKRTLRTMTAVKAESPNMGEYYIRIVLTRGVGELSYDPKLCPNPSVIIIVKPHQPPPPELYDQGVAVVLSSIIRNHPDSINPLIKSNNLLNNALAVQEAYRRNAYEAIMRNHRGEISECGQANLFIVKDGEVLTPPLDSGLLAGITRELVFEIGSQIGVPVHDRVLYDQDILTADEAFLTSTTKDLIPIVKVDDLPIGPSHPGPITHKLLQAFRLKSRDLTNP